MAAKEVPAAGPRSDMKVWAGVGPAIGCSSRSSRSGRAIAGSSRAGVQAGLLGLVTEPPQAAAAAGPALTAEGRAEAVSAAAATTTVAQVLAQGAAVAGAGGGMWPERPLQLGEAALEVDRMQLLVKGRHKRPCRVCTCLALGKGKGQAQGQAQW